MEMGDIFAIAGLEWVYDRLEDRFGRGVAWIATFMLSIASLILVGAIAWYFLR